MNGGLRVPAVGFITGLASEAACLVPYVDRSRIRVAAMRAESAERCARGLVEAGCNLLVSFGLAGALVAGLGPGAVIVASEVVTTDGDAFAADPELTRLLLASLPAARGLPVAGSDRIVASRRDKLALNQRTGAGAVDMESHRVARIARGHGLPFLCVRAVADRCDRTIPRSAFDVVDAEGQPRIGIVLVRLARRPWEVFGLAGLAAYSRAAHRTLRDVAPILLDCLGG